MAGRWLGAGREVVGRCVSDEGAARPSPNDMVLVIERLVLVVDLGPALRVPQKYTAVGVDGRARAPKAYYVTQRNVRVCACALDRSRRLGPLGTPPVVRTKHHSVIDGRVDNAMDASPREHLVWVVGLGFGTAQEVRGRVTLGRRESEGWAPREHATV